jgi:hypothetical protein
MATRRKDDDALGRLAEVMVEDILETPRTELLAEVAEDHGDNQALSTNFDRLVRPAVRRAEMRSANVVRAEREKPRSVVSPIEAIGPQQSSAGRTLVSTVIGWLKALHERTFFSGSGSLFPWKRSGCNGFVACRCSDRDRSIPNRQRIFRKDHYGGNCVLDISFQARADA